MREVDAELLRLADSWACSVTVVSSNIKHSSTSLEVGSARSFRRLKLLEAPMGRWHIKTSRPESTQKRHMKIKLFS